MNIVTIEIFDCSEFNRTVERKAFFAEETALYRLVASAHTWASNRCDELKALASDDWSAYDYTSINYSDDASERSSMMTAYVNDAQQV